MCLPLQKQTNMLKLHLMVTIRDTSGSHEDETYNNSHVMTYSSAVCSVLIHLVVSWCIPQHCVGNGMQRLILVSDFVSICVVDLSACLMCQQCLKTKVGHKSSFLT